MQNNRQRLSEMIAGERARFVAFVRRKAADLSQMEAEDLVEEVLFRLWNRADLTTPIEYLLAYMYRALTNQLIDLRRRFRPTVSLDAEEEAQGPLGDTLADNDADIGRLLQRKELRERLYAAISGLPAPQRAVWVATEVAGYTFEELSRQWGEPIGTLLARKHRATKRLRLLLNDLHEKET